MSKLILNTECGLYERNGKAFCTSRQIAEQFGKEHKTVLRAILDKIEFSKDDEVAAQFCATNFVESKYKDRGKWYPEYMLTRDGFSFIVMGFTGKKADKFKIAYITRFNQMESFIKSLVTARIEYPAFTEAIMNAHDEPRHYHFSNEADMINRIVLGVSAKKFRDEHGFEKGVSIRPYLTLEQIKAIEDLQRVDIGLIVSIPDFEQRKLTLQKYFERSKLKRIA